MLRAGASEGERRPACYHRRGESNDGANELKNPSHDITIAMPCPKCADITRRHFEWFARHTFYGCRKCRAVIEVDPGYRELAKSYEGLVKALNAAFGEFFDD